MTTSDADPAPQMASPADGKRVKLAGIEAGRGIAALLVVLVHAGHHIQQEFGYYPLKGIFTFGHAGVDFFFVLSGFIILSVHYRDIGKPARLPHYLGRRLSRVYPFYWFMFAVMLVLALGTASVVFPSFQEILKSAILIPYAGGPFYELAWTLQHELLFYAVFAILILSPRLGVVGLCLWGLVILGSMQVKITSAAAVIVTSPFNLEFFMGMGAALYLRRWNVKLPVLILICGVCGFMLSAAAEVLGLLDGFGAAARFPYGLSSMVIVLGVVEAERKGIISVGRILLMLGSASYAIYLCHVPVYGVFYKVLKVFGLIHLMPPWVTFILMSIVATIGSVVMSIYIEHPLIAWTRRLRLSGVAADAGLPIPPSRN